MSDTTVVLRRRPRPPLVHRLKTWPEFFEAILRREKTFEIRKMDRDFLVDDLINLEEYNPWMDSFSGRIIMFTISYLMVDKPGFGLMPGFCIMGFDKFALTTIAPHWDPPKSMFPCPR